MLVQSTVLFSLFQVNNASLLGASHKEAVDALRSVEGNFTILVCDGYSEEDDPFISGLIPSPVTPVLFNPSSNSTYSIDQMDSSFTMQQVGIFFLLFSLCVYEVPSISFQTFFSYGHFY